MALELPIEKGGYLKCWQENFKGKESLAMTHSLTQSKCLVLSWPLFLFLILKILTFLWGSDLRLREKRLG